MTSAMAAICGAVFTLVPIKRFDAIGVECGLVFCLDPCPIPCAVFAKITIGSFKAI